MHRAPLRVLFYNHCYGTPAIRFGQWIRSHIWHLLGRPDRIRDTQSGTRATIDLVERHAPDILAIAEVLGKRQARELQRSFARFGYDNFHFFEGHGWSHSSEHVGVLLASKLKFIRNKFDLPRIRDRFGNGGGMGSVFFPSLGANVVCAHMPLPSYPTLSVFREHMRLLEEHLEVLRAGPEPYLVMGDFNVGREEMDRALAKGCEHYSDDRPTCNTNPLLSKFYERTIDHVFGCGFRARATQKLVGLSDHRAVICDLLV